MELQECLRDSPKFRALLDQEEQNIDQLEQRLEKALKICSSMVEAGKTYVGQQSLFANSLWDLSVQFKEDPDVLSALNKLIHSLQEMNKFHTTLLDQVSRIFLKNISGFIKKDIKAVRDYKHHFDKISGEYDNILLRNSHVPRSKTQEVEEVQNILIAIKSCFGHLALNYVNGIYVLQSKKRHEILSTLLSYMHACTIANMRDETHDIEKDVENSHALVSIPEITSAIGNGDSKSPKLEGYLFKRTSNAFKTWNRRWFYLFDNKLVYRRRSGEERDTVMEDDLRICTVKPFNEGERRFCFEVVSPSKSHILQADSEEMYHLWIEALQKGIGAAIQRVQSMESPGDKRAELTGHMNSAAGVSGLNNNNNTSKAQKLRMMEHILKIPGNNSCADCKCPNPKWASINLGILLCIECSGVHRSLGVHYSKVRSLTLDDWEPEVIKVMAELGNNVVNRIYEAKVPDGVKRASEHCTGTIREEWIRTKYVEKKFVKNISDFKDELSNQTTAEIDKASTLEVRKWGVKKFRRMSTTANAKDISKKKKSCGEPLPDVVENDDGNNADTSEQSNPAPSEVWLFGNDLDVTPSNDIIDTNSDEESTEGDEAAYVGEEDILNLHSNLLLYKASAAHNLPVMCQALALGAEKNWANPNDKNRHPLHAAVLSGSVMACAYLLLNGAKINIQDQNGRTPLHLATREGHTAQVCLFLKYRADQHLEDEEGKVPLSMAEQKEHADIVTLLRLGRLNEEMKDTESGVSGDDTFNDVVRDFSRLAYSNPEKLQRNND
ncbi:hypothetical protein YQE_10772, partial [Dendroctonus ponderosae]